MATEVKKKKPVAELFSDLSLCVELPAKIGNGWDNVLIRLGLTDVEVYHIKEDHQWLKDKIKAGLCTWNTERKETPVWKRATELRSALRAEELNSLADDLEDAYCFEEPEDSKESSGDIGIENALESSGDIVMETPVNEKAANAATELAEAGPDSNGHFSLRTYQTEIAQDGLMGHNSIIWAGTGSGKTRVAIYIMKNHLDKNLTGRIAFFSTTLTLLDQQYGVIWRFLPKYKHKITKFSGKDTPSGDLAMAVHDCRVCVLTPMTLVTYLTDGTLSLDVFSMLVFDECHHTRKNEPYNQIMSHYRKLHHQNSTAKLPQILGLTASVGTERARNVQDAEDSMIDLMAKMNVHKIATPRGNIDEYKRFVPDPIKRSEVMEDRATDLIRDTIVCAMKRLEEWLRKKLCDLDKDVYKLLEEMPDDQRMEQQYQTWLSRLERSLPCSELLSSDVKYQAIVMREHLTMYHTALTVNHTLSMKDVLEHLYRSSLKYKILEAEDKNAVIIDREDNTGEDYTGNDNTGVENTGGKNTMFTNVSLYKSVVKKLKDLSKNQAYENPNIVRLQKMVDKNFREKGKDSTFIVFVETRESAIAVSKYLGEKSVFANCCHLVSARSTADDDGSQSLAEHNRVVEKLRTKRINGVVATRVAEEGLDIPACNFVIRYNQSSHEISTIQAPGRSRKKGGTIIDYANPGRIRQEHMNVMRLMLMNQAIDNILGQPDDDVQRKVTERMRTITITEAEEERTRQAQTRIKTKNNFTLRCSRCQVFAVSSCDIRCYVKSQYIVVSREFYTKVKRRTNKKVSCYDNLLKKYKIECKHCGCD